jgi:hypothetical protein
MIPEQVVHGIHRKPAFTTLHALQHGLGHEVQYEYE